MRNASATRVAVRLRLVETRPRHRLVPEHVLNACEFLRRLIEARLLFNPNGDIRIEGAIATTAELMNLLGVDIGGKVSHTLVSGSYRVKVLLDP